MRDSCDHLLTTDFGIICLLGLFARRGSTAGDSSWSLSSSSSLSLFASAELKVLLLLAEEGLAGRGSYTSGERMGVEPVERVRRVSGIEF